MKDILLDLVKHSMPIGLETVKFECDEDNVKIGGITDDHTIMVRAETHNPVDGFAGVFGIPNLSKLNAILHLEPYQQNEVIQLQHKDDGTPSNVHFENAEGTFKNDHRFMSTVDITEKLKKLKFKKEPVFTVHVTPLLDSIAMLGYQAGISDEEVFSVKIENKNLKFYFGDHSTHAGEFIFAADVDGKMSGNCYWFVNRVLPILKLDGKTEMHFDDSGMLKIVVDSGLVEYEYSLPATRRG